MPLLGYESTVLLTGYPGFEARRMLEQILTHEPTTLLYCIVHQSDEDTVRLLSRKLPADQQSRLVLLSGDPSGMDLGLSGKEFLEVASRVDRFYHLSTVTRLSVSRDEAQYANVQGTIEALEVAQAAKRLKCLLLMSSALVSGTKTGVFFEDDLMVGQQFRNPVEETLAHAERIARRAMSTLPIAVVRPSMVVCDSCSGEVDHLDGPYGLILLILNSPNELTLPLPARDDLPLNLVPVDFVVRAAYRIGCDARAPGRTYHLVDRSPLPAHRLFDLVAQAAGRRTQRANIPSYLARAVLRAPGVERALRSPRGFLDYLTTAVRYDTRHAEQILAGAGIVCPAFASYVDPLLAFVREKSQPAPPSVPPPVPDDDDPLSG
jgi:thioester reductase-like protein